MISNIVFFGDSITAANRSPKVPLGVGYVSILKDLFSANTDLKDVQFVNSGVSGHTVGDLLGRFNTDVLDHHPDAVAIMIGINDAYNDFFVIVIVDKFRITKLVLINSSMIYRLAYLKPNFSYLRPTSYRIQVPKLFT
ncbi:MAG: hypothetical protein HOG76_12995 [Candidatus Marinimicrobia bacterium]|jgi:lysophospholipase L1-like esterase|nr:hypothetical protein [Candidatus Neomarinimicrobiota bacterium]MBT4131953.1 hypothetical protein [Candidatus Neomarinimicrobiota bacterium]MBT4421084.1 hypothetical protein [Candidatus Neomarinimicrobiota bacterium]MBT5315179.1 hypothetical protein [Candidatus Neomarinimicrobiota bacterium]MBT5467595.1 hypothetical protein [Candidatus Neomarinimicrobiota bacterium]